MPQSMQTPGAMPPMGGASSGSSPSFLNEPHRDMVIQAQRATNDFSLPLSSSSMIQDDEQDPSVNEVARTFGTIADSPSSVKEEHYAHNHPIEDDGYAAEDYVRGEDEIDAVAEYDGGGRRRLTGQPHHRSSKAKSKGGRSAQKDAHTNQSSRSSWSSTILDDVWLAILVMFAYVLITFVPVEALVEKYIPSMSSIGYLPLLLKAVTIGVVVFVTKIVMNYYGGGNDREISSSRAYALSRPSHQDDGYYYDDEPNEEEDEEMDY